MAKPSLQTTELSRIDRARVALRDAAQRSDLTLTSKDIETLAQRISFSQYVQHGSSSQLEKLASQTALRPSGALATGLASRVRELLNAGNVDPLLHLPSLLADLLNVYVFPVELKVIAGGCALIGGSAFIFVSRGRELEALFMCAHQLAHLIMMSSRDCDFAVLEKSGNSASSVKSPYEHFADAFALELLIPTPGLGIALGQIRSLLKVTGAQFGDVELLYLSRIFGLSFLATAKRCERAELLPKGGAISLYEFLTKKFGGPERRADELSLPPRPTSRFPTVPHVIELATIELIIKGEVTLEQASTALSWPTIDIARACGVSPN